MSNKLPSTFCVNCKNHALTTEGENICNSTEAKDLPVKCYVTGDVGFTNRCFHINTRGTCSHYEEKGSK